MWLWILGCASPPSDPPAGTATDHAIRASLAIRGTRPSLAELDRVAADPTSVAALVDDWLQTPSFGETIRDLHAEILRIRVDTVQQFPARGALAGVSLGEINRSTTEAPLRLIEDLVMSDRPYSEILTADYILADEVLAKIYGLEHDADGPEWQRTWWTDGRPAAGILSSSELYHRYPSNGSNFHRGRANVIASTFLCDDIGQRSIEVDEAPVATSVEAVITALETDPGCAGCHQALEPIASFLWGFKAVLPPKSMAAYEAIDCDVEDYDALDLLPPAAGFAEDLCYPVRLYHPAEERAWEELGLPAPALYGRPGDRVDDLGAMIAADPRFSQCTARHFQAYFLQIPPDRVEHDTVVGLADHLVASDFDAKALVRQIVLSAAFRAPEALHTIRPEQYARTIEALTGYRWIGAHELGCVPEDCWGEVDLARSDLFGFRTLSGGMDGVLRTAPSHTPTPSRILAMTRFASEAADAVVDADFAEPDPLARRLLTALDADPAGSDRDTLRDQLVALHLQILSETADPATVDQTLALYDDALARHAAEDVAFKVVITALLSDPRMVVF